MTEGISRLVNKGVGERDRFEVLKFRKDEFLSLCSVADRLESVAHLVKRSRKGYGPKLLVTSVDPLLRVSEFQ